MKQVVKKKIQETYDIKTSEPIYTLVCDGNSILKNSLVAEKLNSKGINYAPIIQFFLTIKQVICKRDFSRCYVMFDGHGSGQLRANIYPTYKANRGKNYNLPYMTEYDKKINDFVKAVLAKSKQKKVEVKRGETEEETFERCKSIILQMCDELFIRTYEADDVEGDDLIAYVCHNKRPNEKIVIISGDRDLSQLVSDDITLYVLQTKKYVTVENSVNVLGYRCDNIVLQKIICGDSSDNILGIKGVAEKGLYKLFPDMLTKKMKLDDILSQAKTINEERVNNKQKPLKSCENLINSVTDGIQGDKIYEINEKIISLDKPMLTEEAEEFMKEFIDSPLDSEDRDFKNLYNIIICNNMEELFDSNKFSSFFEVFNGIITHEKNF